MCIKIECRSEDRDLADRDFEPDAGLSGSSSRRDGRAMKAELVPENGDPPIPIVRDVTVVGRREYCDVVIASPQPLEAALRPGEDGRAAGDPGPGDDERDEGQGAEGAMGGAVAGRSRSAWADTSCGSIWAPTTCRRPRSKVGPARAWAAGWPGRGPRRDRSCSSHPALADGESTGSGRCAPRDSPSRPKSLVTAFPGCRSRPSAGPAAAHVSAGGRLPVRGARRRRRRDHRPVMRSGPVARST